MLFARLITLFLGLTVELVAFGQTAEFVPSSLRYAPGPAGNPLKGLVPYKDPQRRPDGSPRFPHSMEFHSFPLSELVASETEFDFSPMEELLEEVRQRRHQTVFRVFLEYPGKENVIPQFLIQDGLKIHRYLNTNTAPFPAKRVETPDYENSKLRKLMRHFIAELGKRYDGDPRIAYITAGMLGTWGEWHTYPRTELFASKEVQKEVMDAYSCAFVKTPVLLRYPAGKNDPLYHDSTGYRFGYHDDSFAHSTVKLPGDASNEDNWFFHVKLLAAGLDTKWQKAPIGGEIRPEVWGCCFDEPSCTPEGQSFERCRSLTHVTWLMDTGMFQEIATKERYESAIKHVSAMGYDFFVEEVTQNKSKKNVSIRVKVINKGIAPFYHPGWQPEIAVSPSLPGRGTASVSKDERADLNVLPGESTHWSFESAYVPSAGDSLYLRLPNPMERGIPLRFANVGSDENADGWFKIGSWESE